MGGQSGDIRETKREKTVVAQSKDREKEVYSICSGKVNVTGLLTAMALGDSRQG